MRRIVAAFLHCCVYARKPTCAHFKGHINDSLFHRPIGRITVNLYHGTGLAR